MALLFPGCTVGNDEDKTGVFYGNFIGLFLSGGYRFIKGQILTLCHDVLGWPGAMSTNTEIHIN